MLTLYHKPFPTSDALSVNTSRNIIEPKRPFRRLVKIITVNGLMQVVWPNDMPFFPGYHNRSSFRPTG